MFEFFQTLMLNMLGHAEQKMNFSRTMSASVKAIIQVLSDRRYLHFGLGEEVQVKSSAIVTEADRLSVDALSLVDGRITFPAVTYPYDLTLLKVVLEGQGLSYELTKSYVDLSTRVFGPGEMPLLTNNFQLVVIVSPGGYYQSATVLQRIVMDKAF